MRWTLSRRTAQYVTDSAAMIILSMGKPMLA